MAYDKNLLISKFSTINSLRYESRYTSFLPSCFFVKIYNEPFFFILHPFSKALKRNAIFCNFIKSILEVVLFIDITIILKREK